MKKRLNCGRRYAPYFTNTIRFQCALFLAGVSLLFVSCTTGNATKGQADEQEKTYPVIALMERDTVLELQYVADIQARKNIELRARVEGILEKIYVDEGQPVKKGQLLFRINDEELRVGLAKANAAYESAVADARVAEVEVARVKILVGKKIISDTELDLAEARLNALEAKAAQVRAAKMNAAKRLSYTDVHAPFDGIIDRLPLREGSLLTDGSLLTTISDIQSMYAYFNLSEFEYFELMQTGKMEGRQNNAQLILADGTVYPWMGEIGAAESEIDENTGSIAFRAHFPNPDHLLKHGATGKLIISKTISNALLVPQKAVFEIQDRNYVYVVDEHNMVHMKAFVPAQRIDHYYVVKSGLSANDKIVYEGVQILRDGETINPEMITDNKTFKSGNPAVHM